MPIKFRCTHCNQFLGISRAQTGSVVDCPSCGRSIRVPNLDGTTLPLPKPAIDLSDNSLATALEQLASLEQHAPEEPLQPARIPAIASVAPGPAVVAVPLVPAVASVSDVPLASETPRSTQPWIEVEEQLSRLAGEVPAPPPVVSPKAAGVTRRDLLVAGGTALAVAPLTWWFARPRPAVESDGAAQASSGRTVGHAPPESSAAESIPALTGRITYITADGESRPDAGARVLVFPEHRQGSTLLSVDGFRSSAAAADLQLARESMKLYGGAYVIADEHGRYGADLSSSGTYQVLTISNYQPRPAGPVPADLLNSLGRYFDRPQQLIGQTAYDFAHLRFTGREPAVRDQVFQKA
jgi:hypothetical protein